MALYLQYAILRRKARIKRSSPHLVKDGPVIMVDGLLQSKSAPTDHNPQVANPETRWFVPGSIYNE